MANYQSRFFKTIDALLIAEAALVMGESLLEKLKSHKRENITRQDLLKIFPRLENRTTVIHDMVSRSFFQEGAAREHLSPGTEPED